MRRRKALKLMTASMVSTCALSLEGLSLDEPPSLTVVFTGDRHGSQFELIKQWLQEKGAVQAPAAGRIRQT